MQREGASQSVARLPGRHQRTTGGEISESRARGTAGRKPRFRDHKIDPPGRGAAAQVRAKSAAGEEEGTTALGRYERFTPDATWQSGSHRARLHLLADPQSAGARHTARAAA